MNISYRKLAPIDSKQYREIRLESLKAHPESFESTFEEQSKLPKLMFEKALEQPVDDRFVLGAFDGQELIGICGFVPFVPDIQHRFVNAGAIIQMYVRSTYSGRKIGLNLIQVVIREAFKLPTIDQIVLEVKEDNRRAIRVYKQAGFQTFPSEGKRAEEKNDADRLMIISRRG